MLEPHVSYVGPTAVWWIPKPLGPRTSLASVLLAWLIGVPALVATFWWCQKHSIPLWPFNRQVTSSAEILLRYEIVLLACLAYITVRSLPMWISYHRLARRDVRAIEAALAAGQWELAGLLVHRYCLLTSAVWRRVSARVVDWDEILRPRLPRHRRLYVYCRTQPPVIPPDADASFTPDVIPPPRPPLWSAIALIPIAMLLYSLIIDVIKHRYHQRLVQFNAALLMTILVTYGGYFVLALLGRSHYFRFAPGVIQLVKFGLTRRRPVIETFDVRQGGTILDLSSRWPAMTLLGGPGAKRETFRLPRGQQVVEALLRACLSTAPSPRLSEEDLID